jgi:ABC-type iron transport system FetAB permease component
MIKQKEKIMHNMKNNIIPIIFKTLQQLLLHFLLSLLLEISEFSSLLLILIFPV